MRTNRETPLCRYRYDALDRLALCTPAEHASTRRFYQKKRLATEIQDLVQQSIFQHDDQLLAQRQHQGGTVATTLLITDQQRSVLNTIEGAPPRSLAYTPYGYRSAGNGLLSLLGFNGERPDPVTGHYHLGNGYRQFNPVLMRFNSPDSWSPFGRGGVNAYAYCGGDPINKVDPTGHALLKTLLNMMRPRGSFSTADMLFVHKLKEMKKGLGGNKGIRKAASLENTSPESYLFNRTVNKELDRPIAVVDGYKRRISMANDPESAIMENSHLAIFGDEQERFSRQVQSYLLSNTETQSRLVSVYMAISDVRSEANRMTYNRIMALANVPPDSRPRYSAREPSPPPSYDDAINTIRRS